MDENDKDLEHKSKVGCQATDGYNGVCCYAHYVILQRAAQKAIARTIFTRIAISAPAMGK